MNTVIEFLPYLYGGVLGFQLMRFVLPRLLGARRALEARRVVQRFKRIALVAILGLLLLATPRLPAALAVVVLILTRPTPPDVILPTLQHAARNPASLAFHPNPNIRHAYLASLGVSNVGQRLLGVLPPHLWPLARILEVIIRTPGEDAERMVRVATNLMADIGRARASLAAQQAGYMIAPLLLAGFQTILSFGAGALWFDYASDALCLALLLVGALIIGDL
jgi:hypothetical protein